MPEQTTKIWLAQASASLKHVDSPRLSAELILSKALNVSRLNMFMYPQRKLSEAEQIIANALLKRRQNQEPMAYLLEEKEFYGRNFKLSPGILIPRPETEHLVETILKYCNYNINLTGADLGTGSGCIALTLLAERPNWRMLAVDIDPLAMQISAHNAKQLKLNQRLNLIQGDFTLPLFQDASLDFIVSNPPYISQPEYDKLEPSVHDFEPKKALIPQENSGTGMEFIEHIITHAELSLKAGGWLCLEHGWKQAELVRLLFSNNKWKNINTIKDLSKNDRISFACLV